MQNHRVHTQRPWLCHFFGARQSSSTKDSAAAAAAAHTNGSLTLRILEVRQTGTRHNRFEGTHRLIDKFTATRSNTQTMPSRKSKCWKSSRLARQEKLTSLVACECVLHLARSHTLFQWDVIYKSSSGWLKLVPGLRTAMLVTPEGCCTR